jgi:hypothetical protein
MKRDTYSPFQTKHRRLYSAVLCTFLGLVLSLNCYAQEEQETTVRGLSDAYAKQDLVAAKDYLSPDFAVGIYDRKHEGFLWKTFPARFACDSMVYIGALGADKATVLLYPSGKESQRTTFTFDNKGLVKHIAAFDRMYGVDREAPSRLVTTVPFEEKNGSIILKCRINDNSRELRLLFDTGADGMAVSTALGEELGLKVTRNNSASVVGGNVQIQVSDNNTVHIGDFVFPGQGIALFPNYSKDTDGIIGNTLLKQYIVKVDYDQKLLSLYTMGRYDFGTAGTTLPLEMGSNLHLPISLTMNGGKSYEGQLYFDTGASYNLILFRPFVLKNRLLVDGFKSLGSASTVSMGMSTPTFVGMGESMHIGEQLHTDSFLLSLMGGSAQNQDWQPDADGSLGVGIIGRYNFTVDLLNKRIHFEPNSRYGTPLDFVLADHVFHFDLGRTLFVGKVLDPAGLQYKVVSVDGKKVGAYLKNRDLRSELAKALKKKDIVVEAEQGGEKKVFQLPKG